jgi:hypothetical protein
MFGLGIIVVFNLMKAKNEMKIIQKKRLEKFQPLLSSYLTFGVSAIVSVLPLANF